VKIEEAKRLTAIGLAKWDGPKRIVLKPDESKRCLWEMRDSEGMPVLQMV
jgi:hypothetical protein